jgi:hypothetical protein
VSARTETVLRIADLAGSDVVEIEDTADGWPALAKVRIDGAWVPSALFVGKVWEAHRPSRVAVERRFQNPGQNRPIVIPPGRLPLLVGLWEEDPYLEVPRPVLVLADATRREGLLTRHSVFQSVDALVNAATTGFASSVSDSDEQILYFDPRLLGVASLALADDLQLPSAALSVAVEASGIAESDDDAAAERARRATTAIVRDARFGRQVVSAYQGLCALCGLNLGLVEGAHIYPASAPGSPDRTWNGIALCANHHSAFDRHLLHVHPVDRTVTLHPDVHERAGSSDAAAAFVAGTGEVLIEPSVTSAVPRSEMFEKRYDFYGSQYAWAS